MSSLKNALGSLKSLGTNLNVKLQPRQRHFLTLKDLDGDEIQGILSKAFQIKHDVKHGRLLEKPLQDKMLGLLFQNRSTRTRLSAEKGMSLLGGTPIFMGKDDIQLGANESILDSAQVFSRFCDLLMARVQTHEELEDLARCSSVPVINALTDKYHPLQILADLMTMQEQFSISNASNLNITSPASYKLFSGDAACLSGKKIAWVGDGNNIVHSLMLAMPKFHCDMYVATPVGYEPWKDVTEDAFEISQENGTKLFLCNDPKEAVSEADVVLTDTWVSMGDESQKAKRLKDFEGYQVNNDLMSLAKHSAKFMHCLPKKTNEVSDDIFYSGKSVVFDEAENRLYTAMAVFLFSLGKI
eukprot:Nk52_evm39s2192 gene=Nk52_evmTU39s2192